MYFLVLCDTAYGHICLVSFQDCGRFMCLQLPLSAGFGHTAVDLRFIIPGLRPQLGNATAAEVLRTGNLWPLRHVAHGAVDSWWGGFGPTGASSVLFSLPAWASATVELWTSRVPAGWVSRSVVTVKPATLLTWLALEFHLSAHFSPAVLEPHLMEQRKRRLTIC